MPSTAPTLNTITIGGYGCYDPPKGGRATNIMTIHSGASRYGHGRFLMLLDDYNALLDDIADGDGSALLVMRSFPAPPATMSMGSSSDGTLGVMQMPVVVAGSLPYTTAPLGSNVNATGPASITMVEIVVFDLRVWMTNPINQAMNVQYQGFPYNTSGQEVYYYDTLLNGTPYTWDQVVSNTVERVIDPDNNNLFNSITWTPHNVIYDNTPQNKVWDDIADQLYLVVAFDYTQATYSGQAETTTNVLGCLYWATPGVMRQANQKLMTNADIYRIAGGSWDRSPQRMPKNLKVGFKAYSRDNPNDAQNETSNPFNRVFTVTIPNPTGTSNTAYNLPIWVPNWVAVYEGGNVINASELATVANDIAMRAITSWQVDFQEVEYAGIFPFTLDGAIRGIQWISDQHGARTRIRINDTREFVATDEIMHLIDSFSNQLAIGLGATNTTPSPQGTRFNWTNDRVILGMIVSSGSGGQSDFSDSRYWVQFSIITNTDGHTNPYGSLSFGSQHWSHSQSSSSGAGYASSGSAATIVATNIGEYLGSTHLLPVGTPVLAFPFNDATGVTRWITLVGGVGGIIPVTCSSDGGSNGTVNPLMVCTYTYTAKDLTGSTKGTHLSLWFNRLFPGPVNAAAHGFGGTFNYSGSTQFLLFFVDEQLIGSYCSSS